MKVRLDDGARMGAGREAPLRGGLSKRKLEPGEDFLEQRGGG